LFNIIPEVIERCTTPRGELQLQRRGEHYEIISNGVFLMATYNGESERLLVDAAVEAAARPERILIGGLGVGFSLGAALAHPDVQEVTVVEIEEPVIAWNRRELAPFSGQGLSDSRTRIVNADLVDWVSQSSERFDAICLDIDNGPDWTVTEENQRLYGDEGLERLTRLLNPGGVISVWSAGAAPAFEGRLRAHFGQVDVLSVPQPRGEDDYVYLVRL
jgi:spermidine synthase